jgi:hypothetical protein
MWLIDWDREPIPSPSAASTPATPSAATAVSSAAAGLRSKRNRWEDTASEEATSVSKQQQLRLQQQQQHLTKKQRKQLHQHAQAQQGGSGSALSPMERHKLAARAGRFGDGTADSGIRGPQAKAAQRGRKGGRAYYADYDDDDDDEGSGDGYDASGHEAVTGTCTRLEKSYFRLTSKPDPATVRPPAVLRQVRIHHLES